MYKLSGEVREAMKKFNRASVNAEETELVKGKVLFSPHLNRISVINNNGGVEVYNSPKISMVAHIIESVTQNREE